MHIHISAITALRTFAEVIIIGFFWRLFSIQLKDTNVGKAMAFVY